MLCTAAGSDFTNRIVTQHQYTKGRARIFFLAPTGAVGVKLCVGLWGTSLSRALNLNLSLAYFFKFLASG